MTFSYFGINQPKLRSWYKNQNHRLNHEVKTEADLKSYAKKNCGWYSDVSAHEESNSDGENHLSQENNLTMN